MKYKVLLLLGLLIGCTSIEKPKVDYNKGWIVDRDGTRHFYIEEIILGEDMYCVIHSQNEIVVIYSKKNLKEAPKNE